LLLLVDQLNNGVGIAIARYYRAVRKYYGGCSGDSELFAELHIVINHGSFAFSFRQRLPIICVVEECERIFPAGYCLCIPIGLLMHGERKELYIKRDIFSLLYDLLHLQMKSCAEWSNGVDKYHYFMLGILFTHYDRILEGYRSKIYLIYALKTFLRVIKFTRQVDDVAGDDLLL
jgi:hypothetical protein